MGLVANSGEQMHALLYVSLFLFLGKLPLIVIEWLTFLHSMLREFYCIWQLIFFLCNRVKFNSTICAVQHLSRLGTIFIICRKRKRRRWTNH